MLRSEKELRGYAIQARDGEIGRAHGFLFDDQEWTIRYLVANTGSWLAQRLVLIAPVALGRPDWSRHVFPVHLDRAQVELSPDIDLHRPVSRQHELDLHRHYDWPMYWTMQPGAAFMGLPVVPAVPPGMMPAEAAPEVGEEARVDDPHLRSTREVRGYHLAVRDGEIGHLDDFIVEDSTWSVRYLVVATGNWLPGRKVLVPPAWARSIDWGEAKVHVEVTRQQVCDSPAYDPSTPVNREYEERLYDYYGRPRYWRSG